MPDSVIWRHCASVLHTLPFFTSEPVTRTVRHRMVWSDLAAVASDAAVEVLPCDVDADAGAVTGADAGACAKAEVMIPMVKAVNRIGRM